MEKENLLKRMVTNIQVHGEIIKEMDLGHALMQIPQFILVSGFRIRKTAKGK